MDLLQQPLPSGDAKTPFLPRESHRYSGNFTAAQSEDQSTAYGMTATMDGWDPLFAQLLLQNMCPDALVKCSASSRRVAKRHGTAPQVYVCRHAVTGSRLPCNCIHMCPDWMLWAWGRGAGCPHGNVHNAPGLGTVVHIRPNCISTDPDAGGNVPNRMVCSKSELCLHRHDFVGLRTAAWLAAANRGQVNLTRNS